MTDLETTLDPWWFHQLEETIDISFRVPKGTKKSDIYVNSNNGIVHSFLTLQSLLLSSACIAFFFFFFF
jgi:hypothetical protein